jgi:spermidine synthase
MDAATEYQSSFEKPISRKLRFSQTSTIVLFAITLFVSAALLFSVEPMVAKMLLPLLGGTPAVWNTCILFFQAALLAGYAYAVFASKLSYRKQVILQLLLMALAFVSLPIGISATWVNSVPTSSNPSIWLLTCLAAIVGLPFFILSSNGPLLQKWFADTGSSKSASDPYFLYSASNAGSLLALLSYPSVIEPLFTLRMQSRLWTGGYALMLLLLGMCAVMVWRLKPKITTEPQTSQFADPQLSDNAHTRLSGWRRFRWLLLAFVPSSLMLGVTNYISTDIAAVPLLWIIPLALYLLTLILAFARRQVIPLRISTLLLPIGTIVFLTNYLLDAPMDSKLIIAFNLIYFFIAALTCHQLLAADRPSAKHLVEFYFWLSLGGVLGGVFNALLAPVIFKSVAEYPLVMLMACLFLPRASEEKQSRRERRMDYVLPAIILLVALLAGFALDALDAPRLPRVLMALAAPAFFLFRKQPLRFVLCLAALMFSATIVKTVTDNTLHASRNFFGVLRVTSDADNSMHSFFHGSTTHGRQFTSPERRCEATSYYHRSGPLSQVFTAFQSSKTSKEVAIVGLGIGGTGAYALPDERWSFYEINPDVVTVARTPEFFTYINECTSAPFNIILGDARLRIREARDGSYGLIVLDAFTSDAIPVHLVTQQAVDLYLSKLAPGGFLVFNISNRNLDLSSVMADLAASRNLHCLGLYDVTQSQPPIRGKDPSVWVVMTRTRDDAADLPNSSFVRPLTRSSDQSVWTDDFSNVLSVFRWR